MDKHHCIQVKEGSYIGHGYNTLERFISYYFQTELILKSGAKTVLEIGAGSSITSEYLKRSGLNISTCDFDVSTSPDIIGDIRKIPVPDKSFDVVSAFQVLEHIPFDDLGKALEELCRISRNDIFISVPYRSSFFECVLKFPGIRTIIKKDFLDISLRWPLFFGGFNSSGQHYWEIDSGKFKLNRVRSEIEKHCSIIKEFSPVINKFHYFFVLRPKK